MGESEPMVELAGESSELDALGWWSSHSEFSLYNVEKKDDKYCLESPKKNDKYYLKSPRFGQIRDSNAIREEDKSLAIWEEANKLLPIVKSISKNTRLGRPIHKGWQRSL